VTPPFVAFISIALYHFIQAALIFSDSAARKVTSLDALHAIFGDLDAPIMILASISACLVIWLRRLSYKVIAILPQQFILLVAMLGAVSAIFSQSFADGVVRPFAFIAADQGIYILIALVHLWALCWRAR
jgi:hypothetical protein